MKRIESTRARALVALFVLAGLAPAWSAAPATAAPALLAPTVGIDTSDPAAVLATWQPIVATSPDMGFTGDLGACRQGTVSPAYRQAELDSVNALRALTGVQPTVENAAWSAMAQATAMLMAVNQRLDHSIPDDGSWTCYTTAGAQGAASSDLFLGYVGVDAMWGYIADWGESNLDVGHRRWLLCPGNTQFGFGDVPAPASGTWPSNAVKVFDQSSVFDGATRDEGVAWPNPGLVPLNYAGPRSMLDRFSLQVASDITTAGATVSVTSDTQGPVALTRVHHDDLSYCQPAVSWEPSRLPDYGETWTTTVSGLVRDGEPIDDITYSSTFEDLSRSPAFVKAAYTDFIGSLPSQAVLTQTSHVLDAPGGSRSDLVADLAGSDAWIAHVLTQFYRDTLGREPDASGLAYWTDQLRSGQRSVASVAALFYASPEYFSRVAHGSLAAWVDDLYRKLLGRDPDSAGRAYWVSQAGLRGRGAVAYAFYQSLESRTVRVVDLYRTLLQRDPEPSGRTYWAQQLLSVGDLTLATSLASSSEYVATAQGRFPS